MGYNPNCTVQTCTKKCCNTFGKCPNTTSTSTLQSQCKYYYSNTTTTTTSGTPLVGGAIAGVVVGPIVVLVVLIILIVCCVKKCQQRKAKQLQNKQGIASKPQSQQMIVMNNTQPGMMNMNPGNPMLNMTTQQLATEYNDPSQVMLQNQPYGQPYAQPYGQPYAQPYGQPYAQPYGQPAPPVYDPTGQAVGQALFGQPMQQMPPPVFPNVPNYGPNPIIQ